ncbi:MAG: S8 family serine peptidase [Saprospiraceae bacterium]
MNYLVSWYSKGFWIATFALVLWHALKDKGGWAKLAQLGLVIGITIYAISFSFIQVTAESKLIILVKDLLLLGITSLLFQLLGKYKSIYWLSVILLYAFSKLFLGEWQRAQVYNHQAVINTENEWELLVSLDDKSSYPILKSFVESHDLMVQPAFFMNEAEHTTLDNYYSIEIPEDQEKNIIDIKAQLSSLKCISWLENNEKIQVEPDIPAHDINRVFKPLVNDPYASKQWAADALGWNEIYKLYKSGILKVRKKSKIFILDTGIDGNHEDLKDQYVSIDAKNDTDDKGHGTHVAGIAAAISNNGKGISSVIPSNEFVSITSIKVLGFYGAGTQRDIINGMLKATDNGATVINLSLGGLSLDSRQKAYSEAVEYANLKGCIVVVAAGNDNADARHYAPANADGVITVSAIDTNFNKSSFSNSVEFIKNKIAAPGTDIFSTIPNNQYASFNGTSMAAPYVTGLVALLKSIKPELTTDQVYQILSETGSLSKTPDKTGRIINAEKAVSAVISSL